jgi:tryptophan-rich hypothetical protein
MEALMPLITIPPAARRLNPDKLLLSKWTAVDPVDKEKHFIVTRLIAPQLPKPGIEMVQLEALYSGRNITLPWRALCDSDTWLQGWL